MHAQITVTYLCISKALDLARFLQSLCHLRNLDVDAAAEAVTASAASVHAVWTVWIVASGQPAT